MPYLWFIIVAISFSLLLLSQNCKWNIIHNLYIRYIYMYICRPIDSLGRKTIAQSNFMINHSANFIRLSGERFRVVRLIEMDMYGNEVIEIVAHSGERCQSIHLQRSHPGRCTAMCIHLFNLLHRATTSLLNIVNKIIESTSIWSHLSNSNNNNCINSNRPVPGWQPTEPEISRNETSTYIANSWWCW